MPKVVAKPLSLTVRPFQVSHLCFEVGGILGRSFAELGTTVSAFDFDHLYKAFRDANTHKAVDPGRLEFDSDGIDAQTLTTPFVHTRPFALAALRAEPVKTALNKAINARANAFITKYEDAAGIIAAMRIVLPSKTDRIERLAAHVQTRTDALMVAYEKDKRTGVVKGVNATVDIPDSKTDGTSTTKRVGEEDQIQTSKNTTVAVGNKPQVSTTTEVEYRMPYWELLVQHERQQINISDEFVSHLRQIMGLKRMEEVFKNELASIDADVNQLQVAYLNTILMSPIDGIVTGVYKNPGDPVSAGEPVFRVENNADVLIVAKVGCRGPISIGSMLQVKTTLFDIPSSPHPDVTIEAEVVAVRGEGEDDQWEVIAKRKNTDNAGKGPLFPLGYNFDYDNTEVAIFGAGEI
jgi:hypothetical protein